MGRILTDEPASRAAIRAAEDGGIAAALDRLKGEAAGWIRSAGTTVNTTVGIVDGVLNGAKATQRQHAENVNVHAKRSDAEMMQAEA